MATQYPELFAALAAPFDRREVKTRKQGGRELSYITMRLAQNRLDEVLGPENWDCEYSETRTGGTKCRLRIRLPSGEWLAKEDGGAAAGMPELDNNEKSAYSDAFKRAAVAFGVARYLYQDGSVDYSDGDEPAPAQAQAPRRTQQQPRQAAPPRPPEREHDEPRNVQQDEPRAPGGNGQSGPPRSGKALFAKVKDLEQQHDVGLLKYINGWAKLMEFPGRMVDWDGEQVSAAWQEVERKMAAWTSGGERR